MAAGGLGEGGQGGATAQTPLQGPTPVLKGGLTLPDGQCSIGHKRVNECACDCFW